MMVYGNPLVFLESGLTSMCNAPPYVKLFLFIVSSISWELVSMHYADPQVISQTLVMQVHEDLKSEKSWLFTNAFANISLTVPSDTYYV